MVLVFIENENGQLKKSALEAMSYGKILADKINSSCIAASVGALNNANECGDYGMSTLVNINSDHLSKFDSANYTRSIAGLARDKGAKFIVFADSSTGKSILGRLAANLDAAYVSAANSIPEADGSAVRVEKSVFSGKAIASYELDKEFNVISIAGNTLKPAQNPTSCSVEEFSPQLEPSKVNVQGQDKQSGGQVPLPEAELVVSAGRGMKGPENWGIIEELAEVLGATTACSRPVADTGWRPHHEHVGQTGIAIRPNLYIAAGISGAIQHLAGVSSSKCIVVINKDPEAPFFKAADYGVCADLFDVVPRLTEAIKKAKVS